MYILGLFFLCSFSSADNFTEVTGDINFSNAEVDTTLARLACSEFFHHGVMSSVPNVKEIHGFPEFACPIWTTTRTRTKHLKIGLFYKNMLYHPEYNRLGKGLDPQKCATIPPQLFQNLPPWSDQVCPQRNATASFRLFQSHRTQEN